MPGVTEPETGLVFYELSHEWGHGVPTLPGYEEVKLYRSRTHAKNGVMATRIRMVMHSGTHLNAPLHLIQRAPGIGDIALERFLDPASFFRNGNSSPSPILKVRRLRSRRTTLS